MKRFIAVLTILFASVLLASSPVQAQQPQRGMMMRSDSMRGSMMGPMQSQMMAGSMIPMMRGTHRQMMQNPMHRTSMMAFMLPALADTLGLSDDQVAQLDQLQGGLMEQRQAHHQQIMTHRQELMGLFEGDEQPAAEAVREHLSAMAVLHANQQATVYETALQMRGVLTAEQQEMLDGMTPQQQMRQMMSRMTMMDMMQMMRSIHGGTMGGGMMQNMPMRQGGMMYQGRHQHMPMHHNRQNQ
jgi:hypothetical protein